MQINVNIAAIDLIVGALHTHRAKLENAFAIVERAHPSIFREEDFNIPQTVDLIDRFGQIVEGAINGNEDVTPSVKVEPS